MQRQRSELQTVRAGLLNRLHAGTRSVAVFGPMEVPDPADARRRLSAYLDAGPATRVGLRPDPARRRWRWDPESVVDQVVAVPPASSPEELLTALRSAAPFRLGFAGPYTTAEFDHGVGEVQSALLAALVANGVLDPRRPEVLAAVTAPRAGLTSAALRTLAAHPMRIAAILRQLHEQPAAEPPTAAEPVGWGSGPDTRAAVLDAETVAALRARPASGTRPSVKTLILCALVAALADAGVPLDPWLTMPVDLRRYLRPGVNPLGNMVAGVEFHHRPGDDPAELHRRIGVAVASGRPVAGALRSSVAGAGAILGRRALRPEALPPGPARLLFSGIHGSPMFSLFRWTDPASAVALCRSDPAGPTDITVTSIEVHGRCTLTASFWPDHQDGDRLQTALDRIAADPLRYLD
ncbi:hypothetical protein [Gordonia sp. VNK21]|uniref:hypothetical protein n=1 Tax=Gordonia sp. VNK21 TaxID=3382483 RepID=UPI0038D468C1